jgi:hypothetical protein
MVDIDLIRHYHLKQEPQLVLGFSQIPLTHSFLQAG